MEINWQFMYLRASEQEEKNIGWGVHNQKHMIETSRKNHPKWCDDDKSIFFTNSNFVEWTQVVNRQSHFTDVAKQEEKYDENQNSGQLGFLFLLTWRLKNWNWMTFFNATKSAVVIP